MLAAWHSRSSESALSPDEEIFDPHIHLWDPATETQRPLGPICFIRRLLGSMLTKVLMLSGLVSDLVGFYRMHFTKRRGLDAFLSPYLGSDFAADVKRSGHKVTAAVYVECGWTAGSPDEVAHVLRSYAPHVGMPLAVVGSLNIQAGPEHAAATIVACQAAIARVSSEGAAPQPVPSRFLVGFRTISKSPAPREYFNGGDDRPLDGADAIASCRVLGTHSLTLDVCITHTQLPELTRLAKACPDTTLVLNHLGFPVGIGCHGPYGKCHDEWKAGLRELAKCPNVHVKLSGLGMPVFGLDFPNWDAPPSSEELCASWAPLCLAVIKLFGVGRCLCASNFPPDAVSCPYGLLWNAHKRMLTAGGFSAAERRQLLRDNALALYGLPR